MRIVGTTDGAMRRNPNRGKRHGLRAYRPQTGKFRASEVRVTFVDPATLRKG